MAGLLDDLFAEAGTPGTPQGSAMSQLAIGLLSGRGMAGAAQGMAGYGAAMQAAKQQAAIDELRKMQLAQANQGLEKGGLELQQMRDQVARNMAIRKALQEAETGGQLTVPGGPPAAPQQIAMPPTSMALTPEANAQRQAAIDAQQGQPAQPSPSMQAPGNLTAGLTQRLVQQAGIYAKNGDFDNANKLYEQAAKFMPEVKEMGVQLQNGQPVTVITMKDGSQRVSQFQTAPKVHYMDNGQAIQPVNEYNNTPIGAPVQRQQDPNSVASNATTTRGQNMTDARAREGLAIRTAEADPFGILGINKNVSPSFSGVGMAAPDSGAPGAGPTGAGTLANLPASVANQVQALVDGRMAFPSGFALKSPYWQNMLNLVGQVDPTFDAVNYNKRAQTAQAFSKGKQADAVRAINQTIAHASSLNDASASLDNFNGMATPLNLVVNPVESFFGDSRQGIFKQKAMAVASELRKVFQGSGGSGNLTELKAWEDSLPVNASRQQQSDYLKSGIELLGGAMGALDNQYKTGMGSRASITDLLSPKAMAALAKLPGGADVLGTYKGAVQDGSANPAPTGGAATLRWNPQTQKLEPVN